MKQNREMQKQEIFPLLKRILTVNNRQNKMRSGRLKIKRAEKPTKEKRYK